MVHHKVLNSVAHLPKNSDKRQKTLQKRINITIFVAHIKPNNTLKV